MENLICSKDIIIVICSTAGVLLSYLIAKEIFNSKVKGIWAGYIAAVYPPMIVYTAVYCRENMAISFYLLSVYLFILVIKDKKTLGYLILSGLSLTIGNFFRMVAPVMIVAYLICLLIYFQTSLRRNIVSCVYILGAFIIPLVIVSTFLRTAGITEFDLWKGSESSWTSILKGTNPQSYGRWNEEDAKIVDKYNFITESIHINGGKEILGEYSGPSSA
ncbi:MAG: glycosyltransferase family 39 protein [Clostridiaceae bacterium]